MDNNTVSSTQKILSNDHMTVRHSVQEAYSRGTQGGGDSLLKLLTSVDNPLILVSEGFEILWANDMAKNVIAKDIKGKKFYSLFPHDEKNECAVRKCFEDGLNHSMEIMITQPDGECNSFWCKASVAESQENNRPKVVLVVFCETAKKEMLIAETMRTAHLSSLGEIAAGVAHEVVNPLNGIINYAQMLIDIDSENIDATDIPKRIIKECDRVTLMINNLLSFSKLQKGEKEVVNLYDVIISSLSFTKPLFQKDQISIILEIPQDLPKLSLDVQAIQQVILNIVSNARYALNSKYPKSDDNKTLIIKAETGEREGIKVIYLTFYDTGMGISQDIIDQVYDPFFSTKPANEGSGLGLSISNRIINDHCGKLWIESAEAEYTKVTVELPVYDG